MSLNSIHQRWVSVFVSIFSISDILLSIVKSHSSDLGLNYTGLLDLENHYICLISKGWIETWTVSTKSLNNYWDVRALQGSAIIFEVCGGFLLEDRFVITQIVSELPFTGICTRGGCQ